MRDGADLDLVAKRNPSSLLGEATDADDELRPKLLDDADERVVARGEERRALGGRQLVGRAIPSRLLHEDERAPVRDEDTVEEPLGGLEAIACPTPEARPADLRASASEAGDGPARVLARRRPDVAGDAHEVAHHGDVPEGNSGLRHPERPGVHAEQQQLARLPRAPAFEVRLVRLAGIDERVVDERHGREVELLDTRRELGADRGERGHRDPS